MDEKPKPKKPRRRIPTSKAAKKAARYDRTLPTALTPTGLPKKPKRRTHILSAADDLFCMNYKMCGSSRKAAILSRFHPSTGPRLLNDPSIRQRLEKIDGEMLEVVMAEYAKKLLMTVDFLDEEFMYRLMKMKTHPKVGDIALAKMFEVGYKRTGQIQPAKVTAVAQAGAVATGTTAKEVYKAKWLRDTEAGWAAEFETERKQIIEHPASE